MDNILLTSRYISATTVAIISALPCQTNHSIDWGKVKLPMKEAQWNTRGIKEAVAIKKAGQRALNRDQGRHQLPDVYTSLLAAAPPGGKREH